LVVKNFFRKINLFTLPESIMKYDALVRKKLVKG
jgi:hypothetical protein